MPRLQGGVMWCHVCREGLCGATSPGRGYVVPLLQGGDDVVPRLQ